MASHDVSEERKTARRYLTISEAAEIARVPRKTLQAWVYAGRLKSTKPGRHRLVREDVLYAFLDGDGVTGR